MSVISAVSKGRARKMSEKGKKEIRESLNRLTGIIKCGQSGTEIIKEIRQ